jgi:hypothetical protein
MPDIRHAISIDRALKHLKPSKTDDKTWSQATVNNSNSKSFQFHRKLWKMAEMFEMPSVPYYKPCKLAPILFIKTLDIKMPKHFTIKIYNLYCMATVHYKIDLQRYILFPNDAFEFGFHRYSKSCLEGRGKCQYRIKQISSILYIIHSILIFHLL